MQQHGTPTVMVTELQQMLYLQGAHTKPQVPETEAISG
jgi:hypothetical protein